VTFLFLSKNLPGLSTMMTAQLTARDGHNKLTILKRQLIDLKRARQESKGAAAALVQKY
jgi:hypothetical protein